MADYYIELAAVARIGPIVATHSECAVAVCKPDPPLRTIARHRKAVAESDLRRIHVTIGQSRVRQISRPLALELRGHSLCSTVQLARARGVTPLRDEIVLHAIAR